METRPTWLLIPGHLCDDRLWDDLRLALQRAGAATADADVTRDASIDAMARRALATVDGALVPVGFSMGGMVALRLQALAPGRVAGMVLVDTNAHPNLAERSAARLNQERRVAAEGVESVLGDLLPSYLAPANAGRRIVLDLIVAMARDAGSTTFLRQSEAIRLRPDARSELAAVTCPVLIIAGQHDQLCPPTWQRALAAELADAELHVIPDAGHFLPLEAPQALRATALDWGKRSLLLGR